MPRISVLMGIYNCSSTLKEALDSLYAQTSKDFEIILCEDGSQDNTYEVAAKYATTHANIVLLRNEKNMGLNYTLNKCIEAASGEFMARMDGDDISLPERFEKQVKFLDEHPEFAMVSSAMSYFDQNGIFRVGTAKLYPEKKDFANGTPFCHAPSMSRLNIIREIGGYTVEKKLLRVEDYHLWAKLYKAGYKGANINEPLYSMRDDRNAFRRRTFKSRINEFKVRCLIHDMLELPLSCRVYALRPIIVGLLPRKIYQYLHKNR